MSIPQAQTSDELESVEAQNSLFELLYDGSARAVASRLGQFVYRWVDSVLSIVEKTARWSLPQVSTVDLANDDPNKINISAPPLIRPLPWLLFLPALIALRLLRVALSFMALMLGKPPVCPVTVVSYLQNKRRKLRALKYRGQRLNRISRAELQAQEEKPTWLNRVILPIRTVVSKSISQQDSSKVTNDNHREKPVNKKRNIQQQDSEDSDASITNTNDLLNLLGLKTANDDEDSTFNVAEAFAELSDSCISETEKSDSEGESTQDAPEAALYLETTLNGHKETENPVESPVLASTTKEPEKPNKSQQKSSLNIGNELNTNVAPISPAIEKAEEAFIAENGSSDPASNKQDSKKKTTIPSTKPSLAGLAPAAAISNNLSMTSNSTNNKAQSVPAAAVAAVGEITKGNLQHQQQQQYKIKQHNPQPANLQSQNNQQPQSITANGGSAGGRKPKRPNQTYS